jgi:hypothetical protein
MKALCVCQPWAWLIIHGYKDIENRSWSTAYRGPLLIVASKCKTPTWKRNVFSSPEMEAALHKLLRRLKIKLPETFESGGVVGRVVLSDCLRASESPWFVGPVGWLLTDAEPLPFTPVRGRLKLFDVSWPPD